MRNNLNKMLFLITAMEIEFRIDVGYVHVMDMIVYIYMYIIHRNLYLRVNY